MPKAATQGPKGTAAASSHAPGPSGYRPAPRRRPVQPDKYMRLLFSTDGNDNDISDSEFVLDSDSDSDSDFDSDSESDRDNELREGEDDHRNREVPLPETPDFSFAWSEGSDFVPDLHEFCSDRSGVTRDWPCNDQSNESDFFRAYLDDELMSFVAHHTNDHFRLVCEGMNGLPPTSRARKWEDTTARELIVFISLILLMPLCKKHYVQDYWRNDTLCHPLYGKYMTLSSSATSKSSHSSPASTATSYSSHITIIHCHLITTTSPLKKWTLGAQERAGG
ncbi:uncharacterized protein LOC126994095 [Eriocheir sinensis]|uniref:uncharacterized protein LOC126994095 n=1 Tax=Eriocheir sinensis TaxID=95602 RepID=UPI0021CA0159|nr:uncharacterized protein LOC126994095 [Eriocheir sinensis]